MKLDRLLAITMLLLNRKRVGAKELADRFEVSLRTIYRDLETLNMAGIPIISYAGAAGGYEIMESFRLDRQLLSMDELQSIITALKGIRSIKAIDDHSLDSVLEKVGALVARSERDRLEESESQMIIDLNPWQNGTADADTFAKLRNAVRDCRTLRFIYSDTKGEETERMVEPMGLALKGYAWYLYAYCKLRRDFRVFRLSRMKRVEQLSETFERREVSMSELDARWFRKVNVWAELVLRLQPRARARAEDWFDPHCMEAQADGTWIARTRYPEDEWLYGFLLGFGPDLEVLEPPHIGTILRDKARAVMKMYDRLGEA
jgi:predicted DNA-binding transcriptional regulator YafY